LVEVFPIPWRSQPRVESSRIGQPIAETQRNLGNTLMIMSGISKGVPFRAFNQCQASDSFLRSIKLPAGGTSIVCELRPYLPPARAGWLVACMKFVIRPYSSNSVAVLKDCTIFTSIRHISRSQGLGVTGYRPLSTDQPTLAQYSFPPQPQVIAACAELT